MDETKSRASTPTWSDTMVALTAERDALRTTAEDYDARLRRIHEALRVAGVVAVEGGGVVPAEERVRRLAAERDELRQHFRTALALARQAQTNRQRSAQDADEDFRQLAGMVEGLVAERDAAAVEVTNTKAELDEARHELAVAAVQFREVATRNADDVGSIRAERDAAVKAREEAGAMAAGCGNSENENACGDCAGCLRVGMRAALDGRAEALDVVASLRAQLAEASGLFDSLNEVYRKTEDQLAEAREREGRERGYKADIGNMLQSAIGTLRGIAQAKRFDREVFADDSAFVDWARSRARWAVEGYDNDAKHLAERAALSPSPELSPATFEGFMTEVQSEAVREGPEAVAELKVWGEHFAKEAAALEPSPASQVVEKEPPKARLTIERMDGSKEVTEWRTPAPGKDGTR